MLAPYSVGPVFWAGESFPPLPWLKAPSSLLPSRPTSSQRWHYAIGTSALLRPPLVASFLDPKPPFSNTFHLGFGGWHCVPLRLVPTSLLAGTHCPCNWVSTLGGLYPPCRNASPLPRAQQPSPLPLLPLRPTLGSTLGPLWLHLGIWVA